MQLQISNVFNWPRETSLRARTRIELCKLMFANAVPLIIMALAFTIIADLLIEDYRLAPVSAIAGSLGSAIGFARIAFSIVGSRRTIVADQVVAWERAYAFGSYAFSLCLGIFCASAFLTRNPIHHMLVTALLFGYASGVVSRGSCRPIIAILSLLFATLPIIVTIAVRLRTGDLSSAYLNLDLFFAVFLIGSFESVMHSYRIILSLLVTRAEIDGLARRDHLTGLPNRLEIEERLVRAATVPLGERHILAVHVLDLDGFKAVNDSFGHAIGDRLLEQVATRLNRTIRREDLVGRLGGDEFVIIQDSLSTSIEAETLASRIITTLGEPYDINGRQIEIGASIGIAIDANGTTVSDSLLERADRSLYAAKASGGRTYSIDA